MTNAEFQRYLNEQNGTSGLAGTVHASDNRGRTFCGDTTPGRAQVNVVKYSKRWAEVTCSACESHK